MWLYWEIVRVVGEGFSLRSLSEYDMSTMKIPLGYCGTAALFPAGRVQEQGISFQRNWAP